MTIARLSQMRAFGAAFLASLESTVAGNDHVVRASANLTLVVK